MPDTRRRKLNDELIAALALQLASGCFVDQACAAVGIGSSSLREWRIRGESALDRESAGEPIEGEMDLLCAKLVVEVEKARGKAAVHAHAVIRDAFKDDWKAAAWYLEKTDADNRYGRRWIRKGEGQNELDAASDRDVAIAEIEEYLRDLPELDAPGDATEVAEATEES